MTTLAGFTSIDLNAEYGLGLDDYMATKIEYSEHPDLHVIYHTLKDKYGRSESDQDFNYTTADGIRLRGNSYRHERGLTISLRVLPDVIGSLEELNFNKETILSLARGQGLTLIAGAPSSGKSTLMNAIVQHLAVEGVLGKTITIEEPIKFLHDNSMIYQREVGEHIPSFSYGVRSARRQTPTTLVVGEIRDRETAGATVDAASNGIRCIATIHAGSISQAIEHMWNYCDAQGDATLGSALNGGGLIAIKLVDHKQVRRPIYETVYIGEAEAQLIQRANSDHSLLAQLNHVMFSQDRMTMERMAATLLP